VFGDRFVAVLGMELCLANWDFLVLELGLAVWGRIFFFSGTNCCFGDGLVSFDLDFDSELDLDV